MSRCGIAQIKEVISHRSDVGVRSRPARGLYKQLGCAGFYKHCGAENGDGGACCSGNLICKSVIETLRAR